MGDRVDRIHDRLLSLPAGEALTDFSPSFSRMLKRSGRRLESPDSPNHRQRLAARQCLLAPRSRSVRENLPTYGALMALFGWLAALT